MLNRLITLLIDWLIDLLYFLRYWPWKGFPSLQWSLKVTSGHRQWQILVNTVLERDFLHARCSPCSTLDPNAGLTAGWLRLPAPWWYEGILFLIIIIRRIINRQFITRRNIEPHHPLQGRELSMYREIQWCFDMSVAVKKRVLSLCLKDPSDCRFLMSDGNWFHAAGADTTKDRCPKSLIIIIPRTMLIVL